MQWLQALDNSLFRFINQSLSNPLFDKVMPWFSGNSHFVPLVLAVALLIAWRWRSKGVFCLLMIAIAVGFGDGVLSKSLKHAIERERPFVHLPDTHLLVGRGDPDASMPSSHAVNWFAVATVMFLYQRRSAWLLLPVAIIIGFSRVYNGVHHPGDVIVGAILGAGSAAAIVFTLERAWRWAGRKWLPIWWEKFPSLLTGAAPAPPAGSVSPADSPAYANTKWLQAGYMLVIALTLIRWIFLASSNLELSEDEAYQWVWSKHLALSYYSKPPLIAYTQFLGTTLWGDTEFGVRFFSPLLAGIISIALLRFFARHVNAYAGFVLMIIITATPLLGVGAILMTVDPLSVVFWSAAMLAGWRAIQESSRTTDWLWVGLWMGLGFLSKYTALFQWLCWVVFFALWPAARRQLRRPGPYLALLVNALCMLPVIIWNYQNGWPTVTHVVNDNAKLDRPWSPTLKYFFEFIGGEAALLNPIFFAGILIAVVAFFRSRRRDPLLTYFFSMGVPLFLVYLLWTFHSRVQLNWIAPAILPLLCLMVVHWNARWNEGARWFKPWLKTGAIAGLVVITLMHDTDLIGKIIGRPLPATMDPMRRARAYSTLAKVVGESRTKLLADGQPVFIIGGHYGITGLITFYLPEAEADVRNAPLVYYQSTSRPKNQFYFWPGYSSRSAGEASPRRGQNAIYVAETKFSDKPGVRHPEPAPASLKEEFESVTDLGIRDIAYRGRVFRNIQLFECRNLR